MLPLRLVSWALPICIIAFGVDLSSAQEYPTRPIRIVTSTPGGGNDYSARLIAQAITGSLGQQVIVENRAGIIAIETVAKALPDGHTILFHSDSCWTLPFFLAVSYDAVKDFSPISLTGRSPTILVVNPSVPANSVKELIALAKAKPGELNYGNAALGSATHLGAELFKSMAGVNIVRIPYKSTTPAIADVSAGRVNLMFANASVVPFLKSGKLRAVAVTSAEPSPVFPGLPTVAASGVPGFESSLSHVAFAPARTPAAIINRLHQEVVSVLNTPDVKNKFFNTGEEVVGSSPEQLAAVMKADMVRVGKLIKDAGLRAD